MVYGVGVILEVWGRHTHTHTTRNTQHNTAQHNATPPTTAQHIAHHNMHHITRRGKTTQAAPEHRAQELWSSSIECCENTSQLYSLGRQVFQRESRLWPSPDHTHTHARAHKKHAPQCTAQQTTLAGIAQDIYVYISDITQTYRAHTL